MSGSFFLLVCVGRSPIFKHIFYMDLFSTSFVVAVVPRAITIILLLLLLLCFFAIKLATISRLFFPPTEIVSRSLGKKTTRTVRRVYRSIFL